ncbi:hypothetical protein AQ490_14670 [Wenjunlia vitaminophila]|uniref:DUF4365 domain-containing protein n=1 Tax=Wenjunlia vitaminophila TaxID=76728 RepID=A0A0T6LW19_WENVI|nr:DUF4365 domain-containing protein [Wenjunlia vitaminophila]KRV50339.1 hypothetical protein AQ490_14670 [Wenjunlia vitaminophila]
MALQQPAPSGLLPRRTEQCREVPAPPHRMETLQTAHLHAVAAAAGCTLSRPYSATGTDWYLSRDSLGPAVEDEVTIRVRLTHAHQFPLPPRGPSFTLTLDNDELAALARTPVSVPRILVVMIAPLSRGRWLRAGRDRLELRHCCYWVNLAGHAVTGRLRTQVRISTARIFDDRALAEIMARVGAGGRP